VPGDQCRHPLEFVLRAVDLPVAVGDLGVVAQLDAPRVQPPDGPVGLRRQLLHPVIEIAPLPPDEQVAHGYEFVNRFGLYNVPDFADDARQGKLSRCTGDLGLDGLVIRAGYA
jgi:hypothetical protein